MSLIKAHKRLSKKYGKEFKRLMPIFFEQRDKKQCNALIRDSFPKLFDAIEQATGCTVFKLDPAAFHTLLTGEVAAQCHNKGCTNMCGYDKGKRKYKEFCSKQCANASGAIKERREATMLKKYGATNAYAVPEIQAKIASKNIEKYGTANASASDQVKQKRRKTFQKRYGINSPMESPEFRERLKDTIRANYGVDNPAQSHQAKQKTEATCLERYGVTRVMHDPEIAAYTHQRSVEGSMAKYGVPNAMLHPEVLAKWQDSLGRRTEMTICGKTIFVQGYERFVFERLHQLKPFSSITTRMPKSAMVPYTFKGKQRRYVPDAAIKLHDGTVRVVEVKSWFTLRNEANVEKFKAATKHFNARGIDFVVIIAEPEYDYIRVIVNPKKGLKSLIRTAHLFSSGRRTW